MNNVEKFTAFTVTLADLGRNLHRLKSERMAIYDLRPTHLLCMARIYNSPEGLTPTELAKTCAIDKAFVSRITADLLSRDFIKINEKFNDGRKYRQKYILTERGIEAIDRGEETIDRIIDAISENITDYELRSFYKVLDALNESVSLTLEEELAPKQN